MDRFNGLNKIISKDEIDETYRNTEYMKLYIKENLSYLKYLTKDINSSERNDYIVILLSESCKFDTAKISRVLSLHGFLTNGQLSFLLCLFETIYLYIFDTSNFIIYTMTSILINIFIMGFYDSNSFIKLYKE